MKESDAQSDEELMALYIQGNHRAFTRLYQRHEKRVYTYLFRRLKDEQAAHEVFQNVFLKLHRSREQYKSTYLFVQWLYVIARSLLVDYLRKKRPDLPLEKVEETLVTEDPYNSSEVAENEIPSHLLQGLSEREKDIIKRHYIDQEKYEEMAQTLGLSSSNLRKIASRALAKLRRRHS